jgi:hypothetical protein
MGPEPTYGKRLHRAAREDFKGFWSLYRYWVTVATGLFSPILIQLYRHGWRSVVNLDETVTSVVVGLLVSMGGTYLIAMRRGAETLDAGLRNEVTGHNSAASRLSEEVQKLQEQLTNPPISRIEQSRRDSVGQKLQLFPSAYAETAKSILKYVLEHGQVNAFELIHDGLLGGISNPDLIEKALEKALGCHLLRPYPGLGPWTSISVSINPELKPALSFHLLGE